MSSSSLYSARERAFMSRQTLLEDSTNRWLVQQCRTKRKLEAHNSHVERKRMAQADDRCTLVENAVRAAESSAMAASGSDRPEPKFRSGQSVHHYWASWFPGCGPGQHPQLKKNKRPAWYSSEIVSVAAWKTDLPYAGTNHTGWAYLCY